MMSIDLSQPGSPGTSDALVQAGVDYGQALAAESRSRFQDMLPRIVERVVGPAQAREALDHGGFLLNESTVVLRHNPDTHAVEFFCDVGLPPAHAREAAFRVALEMNLCRTHPGITFGVHPESGRMVATTAIHSMLIADDEVCVHTLQMLTRVVRELRDSRVIEVDTDA
jgi:hypothetical protein